MDEVTARFEFKIGDEVTLRGMTTPWSESGLNARVDPQKLVVIYRSFHDCVGGPSVEYACRPIAHNSFGTSGFAQITKVFEQEIVAYPATRGEHP